MYDLQVHLEEITGMDEITLQPVAGSQGEWTALMVFKAFHARMVNHTETKSSFLTQHTVLTLHQQQLPALKSLKLNQTIKVS